MGIQFPPTTVLSTIFVLLFDVWLRTVIKVRIRRIGYFESTANTSMV